MNYNSIEEILSAGTSNMEVIRNNSKQDDGTDTITGVDWFTFNGNAVSKIYASGNSWIGFGSNSEHLKVNRRDAAMWYLYREEGTLCNKYKFLKLRWVGYSTYNQTSSKYLLSYDVILWDTGDISLHMISIPTSYNNGTYSLVASSTYSYTVSSSLPDITFKKTDSGFTVNNSIIELDLYNKRYLIRSNSTYYTIIDDVLSAINVSELTSDIFLNYGTYEMPPISLLTVLNEPEILFWHDSSDLEINKGLVIKGTPSLPRLAYYEIQNISDNSGIEKAELVATDDVLFTVTFDNGQTWKYYSNGTWNTASSETEGMSAAIIKNISSNAWEEVATSTTFQFRCALMNVNSSAGVIYIKYK